MPRYKVTVKTVEVVEADNPFQAAAAVAVRDTGVEILDVARTGPGRVATPKPAAPKVTEAPAKRQLSPEAKAKLAQNLVKARAARAAKRKTEKKALAKAS